MSTFNLSSSSPLLGSLQQPKTAAVPLIRVLLLLCFFTLVAASGDLSRLPSDRTGGTLCPPLGPDDSPRHTPREPEPPEPPEDSDSRFLGSRKYGKSNGGWMEYWVELSSLLSVSSFSMPSRSTSLSASASVSRPASPPAAGRSISLRLLQMARPSASSPLPSTNSEVTRALLRCSLRA
ncbi:hypothetical protein EYF80_036952 [Liparis tanakae]|uniref:Uncharacterized protein n=1 Tax=Liparis tanakae TaxID=230148 RepID=A0A4Z2GJD6_9TELE|nr:hypothetical protein EYF80_036952 [Liparis tanakae]